MRNGVPATPAQQQGVRTRSQAARDAAARPVAASEAHTPRLPSSSRFQGTMPALDPGSSAPDVKQHAHLSRGSKGVRKLRPLDASELAAMPQDGGVIGIGIFPGVPKDLAPHAQRDRSAGAQRSSDSEQTDAVLPPTDANTIPAAPRIGSSDSGVFSPMLLPQEEDEWTGVPPRHPDAAELPKPRPVSRKPAPPLKDMPDGSTAGLGVSEAPTHSGESGARRAFGERTGNVAPNRKPLGAKENVAPKVNVGKLMDKASTGKKSMDALVSGMRAVHLDENGNPVERKQPLKPRMPASQARVRSSLSEHMFARERTSFAVLASARHATNARDSHGLAWSARPTRALR